MILAIITLLLFAFAITWADFTGHRRTRRALWYIAAGTLLLIGFAL